MSEQLVISKEVTFWDLLKSNEIIIPKIQRDFAQGRDDKKIEIIRTSILKRFKTVLSDENKKLSLDFVYGSNENKQIIPLDGQQRLTTLFLLHLYLAKISGKCSDDNKAVFKKFKYEIRSSTQKFINALIENALADDLENQSWFFNSWKKDPTVKGMLVMFSAISEQFKNESGLWDKLINKEKITFYFLPLDKFKLTDELYVKMNSRGKSLSDFENFKSWLDERLEDVVEVNKVDWSLKLDTVWTDLFWEIDNGNNSIDEELITFFKGVALFNYVEQFDEENSDKTKNEIRLKEFQQNLTDLNNNKIYISNSEFETYLFTSNGTIFNDVISFLDFYAAAENRTKILKFLKEISFVEVESDSLKQFIQNPNLSNKVLFYGLFKYVNFHKNIEEVHFKDCFRILRNLVENSNITAVNFKNILKSTEELVKRENLLNEIDKLDLTGFDGEQIKEEKLKAKLIKTDLGWKNELMKVEKHLLFKGNIMFLLSEDVEFNDISKFIFLGKRAQDVFCEDGVSEKYKEDSIFLRAFISQMDKSDELLLIYYDNTKNTWKNALKKNNLRDLFISVLTSDILVYKEWIKMDSQFVDLIENDIVYNQKMVHENLYKTNLLSCIVQGCNLRWVWNRYLLAPYNAKAYWKKYIIGSKRNDILNELIMKFPNNFTCNQKLTDTHFFWGWNVVFKYNEIEFEWREENVIYYKEIRLEVDINSAENVIKKLDSIIV